MIREASELGLKPGSWPKEIFADVLISDSDNDPHGRNVEFRLVYLERLFGEVIAAHYLGDEAGFTDYELTVLND